MDKINKIYKPGECIKYMHVELHPALSDAWYCGDVRREVTAVGAHVDVAADICDPALVLWSRAIPATLDGRDGQLQLAPTKQRCTCALYVQPAEDIAEHVSKRSLAQHVNMVKSMVDCAVTLVVFGVKNYFKSSGRKTNNSNRNHITEIDLEMAITGNLYLDSLTNEELRCRYVCAAHFHPSCIYKSAKKSRLLGPAIPVPCSSQASTSKNLETDLLVSADCDTVIVNTPNELALLIVQFTKAIAEAPHKKAKRDCDEQAEFYMRGENKQCVALDKDGNGMGRLWQQMVAILPQSSLETSRALCAQYKTPRDLYKGLQSSNAVNEIADIGVARAAVPGARARRIGPEFARKLQILFTSEDGDVLVE